MWKLALVGVVALFGCKKRKYSEDPAVVIERFSTFVDQMCACKDKACADHVQEGMTAWSTEMAKKSSSRDLKPDEASMKRMTELGTKYAECMTKVMGPAVAKPDEPAATSNVPATATTRNADALVRQAREWAATALKRAPMTRFEISYVDAEGILDPIDGALTVEFGQLDPNAKRRLGAPQRVANTDEYCQSVTTKGKEWERLPVSCVLVADYAPRCTVTAIWKRAIEKKAPAEAIAVISFEVKSEEWEVKIDDEPTKFHFAETFKDDCELNVER